MNYNLDKKIVKQSGTYPSNSTYPSEERKTDDRLIRRWVGLIDRIGNDCVKRRSVILHPGKNNIHLFWKTNYGGVISYAALYENICGPPELTQEATVTPVRIQANPKLGVELDWNLDVR